MNERQEGRDLQPATKTNTDASNASKSGIRRKSEQLDLDDDASSSTASTLN